MGKGAPRTLAEALAISDEPRCITSATKPYKIMHTNAAWSKATGYKFTDASGKTCSILQGPETEQAMLNILEKGITAGKEVSTKITNYTAEGKPFNNTISISPLCDGSGAIAYYHASLKVDPVIDGSIAPVTPQEHSDTIQLATAWGAIRFLEAGDVEGVAAEHSKEARVEAAAKITGNHTNIVADIVNDSTKLNIDGKPLTQLELKRVSPQDVRYVDQFLREVARRLLLNASEHEDLEEIVDPSETRQANAWVLAAEYLKGRIQSQPSQKPGRKPDLSEPASKAMKAVMAEVAGEAAAWDDLRLLLEENSRPNPRVGVAAEHEKKARDEVAAKLIYNHTNVLRDITNPAKVNIHLKLLTQQYLRRVPFEDRRYVDTFLQELTGRLLGKAPGSKPQNGGNAEDKRKSTAFVATSKFLEGRIQSMAAQKPGRAPDMSQVGAAAIKAVMSELTNEHKENTLKMPKHTSDDAVQRIKRTLNIADIHSVFHNEEDAIILTEPQAPFKITHVNKAWCDMCGYSMEEIEGATNAILQGPDTDMNVVKNLMDCVRRNEPAMGTVYNYKKGGTRFVNEVQIEPVYDENEDICQFMAILHEIDMMPKEVSI